MDLNYNIDLNLDQKQEFVLTPKLRMSIEILQYNSLELNDFIDEKIKENPLLERLENHKSNKINYSSNINKDRIEYEKFISYQPTFYESLKNQLFEVLAEKEMEAGKFIIGSFNGKGEITVELDVIAELFSFNLTEVKEIVKKIKSLDIDFNKLDNSENKVDYVDPDIIVKKEENDFKVIYKEKFSPTLGINNYYYNLLKNSDDEECKEYLKEKHQAAIWLIKSIVKRRETIKKIAEAIVKKQKDFFKNGIEYLDVMTMEEIAEEIEMHESTVSRATTGKYMQTPHGTFSLKLFFNSGIKGVSSVSIKAIISKEIKKEDKLNPLSDSKLAKIMKNKYEININRRTLANYRRAIGIDSSRARKK